MKKEKNMDFIEEENGYFKNIIKDALKDLKSTHHAFVFFIEQVEAIKQVFKGKLEIEEKEGIYYLTSYK